MDSSGTKAIFGLIGLGLLAGCSSARVPALKGDDFPVISFKALDPKTLSIDVKNLRSENAKEGNSKEVEAALKSALSEAATRGGFKVTSNSRNRLAFVITDYAVKDQGQCVKVAGILTSRWGTWVGAESYGCHTIKHLIGVTLGGDIAESYRHAISIILDQVESRQMEILGHQTSRPVGF